MSILNRSLFVHVVVLLSCVGALAQNSDNGGIGKIATPEEIRARDISISPDGKGLPAGRGTAKEGALLFVQKCALCHGPTGEESKLLFARLVGGIGTTKSDYVGEPGTFNNKYAVETPGSMWPFATAIWDFINRAMPEAPTGPDSLGEDYLFTERPIPAQDSGKLAGPMIKGENLTPDQVYAATAYILYRNGIIKEDAVMDRETLPKVVMPNRNGFLPPADVPFVWTRRDPKTRIEPHISPNSNSSNTKASPIIP